jgi:hypothetical protein
MSKYEFEMKEPTGCDKCPFCNKGDDFYDIKTENPTRTYCIFPVKNNNARTVYLNWPYNVVPTYCPLKAAKCDRESIKELSTIKPEVRHGRWMSYTGTHYTGKENEYGDPEYKEHIFFVCSNCRRKTVVRENFCPNCGARMGE